MSASRCPGAGCLTSCATMPRKACAAIQNSRPLPRAQWARPHAKARDAPGCSGHSHIAIVVLSLPPQPGGDMEDRSDKFRAFYAQLICAAAKTTDPRIEQAFRAVRREPFAGPGPWSISFGGHPYVVTPDDDPAFLYQNALLALDPARGVNIGAGTGYYTAILAELVGPGGRVYAYEIDERLAALARANLKDIAEVELRERSGIGSDLPTADVVYVCAGAAQPAMEWLEALRPGGRLVFPLAPEGMLGGMLMITRPDQGAIWPAKFLGRAQFI